MTKVLGDVRQIGLVVRDIEKAMGHWSKILGVGPWFYKEKVGTTEFSYYGKPSALPELSIALANSGGIQLELIQQRNNAPSLYLDFLGTGAEGIQHVAYWTFDHFDQHRNKLLTQGYQEGHAGRMGEGRGRFAYLLHPDMPGNVIELSEMTGGKGEYFAKIAEAHTNWDGEESVIRID
ncbi:MAG: VOC family protein [Advenella sp.]